MATKVNIKFVIVLTTALVLLFGLVGYVAYVKLTVSGEEYEAKGDALMQEALYDDAATMYKRAHRRDPTNIGWLTKWRDALLKVVPETQVEYQKYYRDYYLGILGRLAALQETDPAAQRAFLAPWFEQLKLLGATAESWQKLSDLATTLLDRLPQDDPAVESMRRYRGLTQLRRMEQVEERDSDRNNALEDLQAALKGDPDDVESAIGVIQWRFLEWKRAFRLRRTQTADRLWKELGQEIISVKEHFGNEPHVLLKELQIALSRVFQLESDPGARLRMIKQMKDGEKPLLAAIAQTDPSSLDATLLTQTSAALKMLRPADHAQIMSEIIDRALKSRPDAPDLMLMRAQTLIDLHRYEDAIALLEKVVEMPNRPVSLQGLLLVSQYRLNALYQQGDAALELFALAKDADRRAELLEQAKGRREALLDLIPGGVGAPIMMLLDGRIAMAENRPGDAVERLKALDDATGGEDTQVIGLLGRALLQSNILGAAKEQYQRLIDINPGDVKSLFTLAAIDRRLHDLDAEAKHLQEILDIAPDLTEARVRLAANSAERGVIESVDTTDVDPVRIALIRWRALMKQDPPEPDEAIKILQEASREHGDDPRLLYTMILHFSQEGDAAAALDLTNKALALYPDDSRFSDWKRRLEMQASNLSIDDRLALIDDSDAGPIAKMISKMRLLRSAGRDDEADALFEQASQQAPDNPVIIEAKFTRALVKKDYDQARSIAGAAAKLNLDSVNGQLFQGRLELAQGDTDTALATLQQVVGRLPYDPLAQRLLGQTYLRLGQTTNALEALQKAFESKPDGLLVARIYVQTLIGLNRRDEALNVVKQARKFNGADRVLTEQWLNLEELVGDRTLARSEREKRNDPKNINVPNALALVRILLDDKSWDEARQIIDEARAAEPANPILARMDANWHALQGDVDAGADILRKLHSDDSPINPLLTLAKYYDDFGRPEDAATVLKDAEAKEAPDVKLAELMLAEIYFNSGRYEQAIPLYQEGIDSSAEDENQTISRRLAQTLFRLKRYDEAKSVLLSLKGVARDDPRTNLLLAKIAAGQDDRRAANAYLDAAVESAPNNPAPFIERAKFNSTDPDQLDDVLEDLNQAIRLNPQSIVARQLKATVLAKNGRAAEASSELQAAIDANPDVGELRLLLINQLKRMGRSDQAAVVAEQAAAKFPDQSSWQLTAGDLYARAGRWEKAADRYRAAYAIDPKTVIAVRLAQAQLAIDPPLIEETIDLLNGHRDDQTLRSTVLLLLSQANSQQDNTELARSLAAQSLDAASNPGDLRDWFSGLNALFTQRDDVLAFLQSHQPKDNLRALYTVLQMSIVALDPNAYDDVIARLRTIEPTVKDPNTAVDLHRLLGRLLFFKNEYSDAAEIYKKAVALRPNDLEFNNNLAYLLARFLNDADGALAPAEKAAQISPADPNVLDTLGWVYFQLGKLNQAQASLNRALQNAQRPDERVPAYLHLADTLIAEKEFTRARRSAETARDLIKGSPALKQQFQTQLDTVMSKLKQTE